MDLSSNHQLHLKENLLLQVTCYQKIETESWIFEYPVRTACYLSLLTKLMYKCEILGTGM